MPFLDTSVKWMHEGFRGAPVLNGTAGSLLACLRAFLISGFGATVANSITVSGGIATATLAVANGFEKYSVIVISGAADAALNGEARISAVDGMTVSWPTTASDGAKSGTITLKYAPVGGWQEVFTGTNLAVFRSTDIRSSGMYLRVDDSGTQLARVVGYEAMSDVNTGTGPFPTDAQVAGGASWPKSYAANATAIPYVLTGDALMFSLNVGYWTTQSATFRSFIPRFFGDPISFEPAGDPYGCVLSASHSSTPTSAQMGGIVSGGEAGQNLFSPRAMTGLGGCVRTEPLVYGSTNNTGWVSGASPRMGVLAGAAGGRLLLAPVYYGVGTSAGASGTAIPVRGIIPGFHIALQNGVLAQVPERSIVDDGTRKLLAIPCAANNATPTGVYFVDITGPWRG